MALTAAAANRLLEREAWARERLAAFAGRSFMVRVGPVTGAFRIDSRGLL
jgi:ubiquinone biosynthesis protein UbiJ